MIKRKLCSITVKGKSGCIVYKDTFSAENALLDLTEQVDVTIENIDEVPSYIFSGKPGIKSVSFGTGVSSIAPGAFTGCVDLNRVSFTGSNVLQIGEYAFSRCYNINEFDCGNTMRIIDKGAFFGCRRLKSITFNRGLIYIGPMAFAYCQSLSSVNFNCDMQCRISTNAFHQSLTQYAVRTSIAKILNQSGPIQDNDGNKYHKVSCFKEKVHNRARQKEKTRLENISENKKKSSQNS